MWCSYCNLSYDNHAQIISQQKDDNTSLAHKTSNDNLKGLDRWIWRTTGCMLSDWQVSFSKLVVSKFNGKNQFKSKILVVNEQGDLMTKDTWSILWRKKNCVCLPKINPDLGRRCYFFCCKKKSMAGSACIRYWHWECKTSVFCIEQAHRHNCKPLYNIELVII